MRLGDGNEMRLRLTNNTKKCDGPQVALFHDPPPAYDWLQDIPQKWVMPGGVVNFVIAKGTLVPHALITRQTGGELLASGRMTPNE